MPNLEYCNELNKQYHERPSNTEYWVNDLDESWHMPKGKAVIKHLTLSGNNVGQSLCNCDKQLELQKGNIFVHYGSLYHVTDEQILTDPSYCEKCKEALRQSLSDEVQS